MRFIQKKNRKLARPVKFISEKKEIISKDTTKSVKNTTPKKEKKNLKTDEMIENNNIE